MAENEKSLSLEIVKLTEKMASDPSSRLFVLLAEEYMKSGMVDEAHMVLTEGLKIHPKYLGAHVSLGKLYWQQGKKQEAKEELEQVVKANPDNVLAHRYLVQIYKDEGQINSALSSCRMILSLNPKDPEMREVLEDLEISPSIQGEGEKASPVMEQVPQGEVDFPQSGDHLGLKVSSGEDADDIVVPEMSLSDVNPDEGDPQKADSLIGEGMTEKDLSSVEVESPSPFENPQEMDLSFIEETPTGGVVPDNPGMNVESIPEEHPSGNLDEERVEPLESHKEMPTFAGSKEEEAPKRVSEGLGTGKPANTIELKEGDAQETSSGGVLGSSEGDEETVLEISEESVEDLKSLEKTFASQFGDPSEGENHQSSLEGESFVQQKISDVHQNIPAGQSDLPDTKGISDLSPRDGSPSEQEVQRNKKDEFETESLAELYIRQGYYDKGIEIYRGLIKGDPTNSSLKQKLEDAVTLSSLLTGKNHGGFSSLDSPPIESEPVKDVKRDHPNLESALKPSIESQMDSEKTPKPDSKTAKVQRLQSWLENIKKGQKL